MAKVRHHLYIIWVILIFLIFLVYDFQFCSQNRLNRFSPKKVIISKTKKIGPPSQATRSQTLKFSVAVVTPLPNKPYSDLFTSAIDIAWRILFVFIPAFPR